MLFALYNIVRENLFGQYMHGFSLYIHATGSAVTFCKALRDTFFVNFFL